MAYHSNGKKTDGDVGRIVDVCFSRIVRHLGYGAPRLRGIHDEWKNYREQAWDGAPTSKFFLERFHIEQRWYRSFLHDLFQKFDYDGKKPDEEPSQMRSPSALVSRLREYGVTRYTFMEIAASESATLRAAIPRYLELYLCYKPRTVSSVRIRRKRGVSVS